MNKKHKIAIIQDNPLFDYRVPIYNELSKKFDVTVIVNKKNITVKPNFKIISVEYTKFIYFFKRKNFTPLIKDFDVIINMFNIRFTETFFLTFSKKYNKKTIQWGIGLATKPYFDSGRFDKIRLFLAKKAACMIFYGEYAKQKYIKKGIEASKIFVANNTIYNNKENFSFKERNLKHFLFIGTLSERKGLMLLLKGFKKYLSEPHRYDKLIIIGDGTEKNKLQEYIKQNKLENNIFLIGALFDDKEKEEYFLNSVACISPKQAGLSVLESFSYGVPFITSENAVTGGERLNIKHLVNGILTKDDSDSAIAEALHIFDDKTKAVSMAKKAREHYVTKAHHKIMIDGFIQAANCIIEKKKI